MKPKLIEPKKQVRVGGRMFRRSVIWLFYFAVVLICAVGADAQDRSIDSRILQPVGSPTRRIQLKIPSLKTTYRSTNRPTDALGPVPGLPITSYITFRRFMREVEAANLALAAQRYNVPIAEAQLTAASVYPDPTFQA